MAERSKKTLDLGHYAENLHEWLEWVRPCPFCGSRTKAVFEGVLQPCRCTKRRRKGGRQQVKESRKPARRGLIDKE